MTEKTYRILAVAATPFFVDRGGHIHIYEQIRALQELGHQVTLVTYHIGRDLPGIDIRRIKNVSLYDKTDAGPAYGKLFLAVLMLWKTLRVAREIKPDLIHAHGWDALWVAWWVSRITGIPYLFDMQGSFSGEIAEHGYARKDSLYYRLLAFIEKRSLMVSPVVVTSSTQICQASRQRFSMSEDHLFAILDGVDTDAFSPEAFPPDPELRASLNLPDKPVVIFMGLLKTYQGVDDMLEAVRIMVHERAFTDFHFLVLGFPDEDYYRAMAAEKGIAEYMTFTGKVPYAETAKYLALADLAIAPKISTTEGDGKIYHYMAMGLPVVAYERPASIEILGDRGIYAKFHDPADLARALHETLQNPELIKQRGRENREKAVNEYSWQIVARRILNAYDLTIRRMKPRQPESESSQPRSGLFWRWFRVLMGVAGLIVLFTLVDMGEVSDALSNASWLYLIPAWVLLMLATGFKTMRWMLLLQQNRVAMSFRRLYGTYLIGAFYSQFLPGSSAGGDAMRMAESSVDTGRAVDSVAAVIVERAVGLISILASAGLILLFSQPEDVPSTLTFTIYGLSITGIVGLVVLRFGWFIDWSIRILAKPPLSKLGAKVEAMSHALQTDLGEPKILAQMIVLSLLANVCSMSAFYLALVAITDPVPFLTFISLTSLIVTIEIIPLTPGSLGVREGAYVFFLGYMGINEPTALSIGLLIRFISWSQALLGGLILLQRGLARGYNQSHRPAPTEPGA